MKVRSDSRKLFFVLIAGALLAGCQATPTTQFDWGVNTSYHRAALREHREVRPAVYADAAVPMPTPRPASAPGWYEDHPAVSQTPVADPAPQPTGDVAFMWPVRGHIVANFGSSSEGERNDGIDIAAGYGEPIRAAASGNVSYAGDELKSYGNLILIRHGGDYVTAYAHASKMVVNRGQYVAKGQIIGYVGSTGDVSAPELHFEIRHGVHPVDPRLLLGPLQVASRY